MEEEGEEEKWRGGQTREGGEVRWALEMKLQKLNNTLNWTNRTWEGWGSLREVVPRNPVAWDTCKNSKTAISSLVPKYSSLIPKPSCPQLHSYERWEHETLGMRLLE